MIQRRQSGKSKEPLRIVNRMDSPCDVVDSGGYEDETMKSAAADEQGLSECLPAVNYLRGDAIERDVHGATERVELRGADGRC